MAHCSRMVDSNLWHITRSLELQPREGSLINVEAPDITNRLGACITTEDKEVWLIEHDGVAISSAGSLTNDGNDHPLRHCFSVSQVKQIQIIRSQAATASGSSVNNHLKTVNSTTAVSSSGRGSNTSSVELLPLELHHAKSVGVTCNHVLSSIASGSTE